MMGLIIPIERIRKKMKEYVDKAALKEAFEEDGHLSAYIEEMIDSAPSIRIPAHGRLIDADKLKAVQQKDADLFRNATTWGEKSRRDEALNAVANIVNAPTVIPAEEGQE